MKQTRYLPKYQIHSNPNCCVLARSHIRARNEALNVHQQFCMFTVFICRIEPMIVKVALEYIDWVVAMPVELSEFDINKVWRLIP